MYNLAIYLAEKWRLTNFFVSLLKTKFFNYPPPVIVYQMGKVGSASVIYSIKKSKRSVFQVHRANLENIQSLRKLTDSKGLRRRVEEPGRYIGKMWNKGKLRELPLIVLFRSPLQRNLSAFFQNQDYYFKDFNIRSNADFNHLLKMFVRDYNHNQPVDWIKSELNYFFPEIILESKIKPFIQKNICILPIESEDKEKVNLLNSLLGTSICKIIRKNEAKNKDYHKTYNILSENAQKNKEILSLYKNLFNDTIFHKY